MTPPAAAVTGRTLPRTAAPRAPRRVSGPAAKPRRTPDARTRRAPVRDPFIVRAIERTVRMADSRFLDRLIRGRLWIPLVAMGLMGIVFMQVSMLKLNAGIGRAVQASATLERQNSTMRAEVSGMESGSKIYATAKDIGMVAPAASTTPSYVRVGGAAQAAAAAKLMTPADPDAVARAKAAAMVAGTGTGTGTTTVAPVSTAAATTAGTTAPVTATAAPAMGTGTTTAGTTGVGTATTAATGTGPTGTGAATATGTPATTGAATTGAASTTGATGAATTATIQPQQSSTSGGAVAPTAG